MCLLIAVLTAVLTDDYCLMAARYCSLQPAVTEAIPASATLAPGMLRHIDYAVNPTFADSVLVPPERVAPAQIGRKPVPPLPDEVQLGPADMLAGSYTGYTVADTIRPGKAMDRLGKISTDPAFKIIPALGGKLVDDTVFGVDTRALRPGTSASSPHRRVGSTSGAGDDGIGRVSRMHGCMDAWILMHPL